MLFLLIMSLAFSFMYFLSSDESDKLDDKSDNDGSDSRSSGTHCFLYFSLRFENSVVCISGLWSGVFVPIGFEYKCDIFGFVVFVTIGVKPKDGRLIKIFWRSNILFYLQILN